MNGKILIKAMAAAAMLLGAQAAQAAESATWHLVTNDGQQVAMTNVAYLLSADDDATFAVSLKDGSLINGVTQVTFAQKAPSGIDANLGNGQIAVFPTLVSESLTLSGCTSGTQVEIVSLQGKVVKSSTVSGSDATIDVSDLAAGYYLLHTAGTTVKFMKR